MGVALGAGAELAIGIGAHREHSACLGDHMTFILVYAFTRTC